MIKRLIAYFGKRSHNIQVQLMCASLYGLVSLYGVFGSVAILFKVRKATKRPQIVIIPLRWKMLSVTLIVGGLTLMSIGNHHLTYHQLYFEWITIYACVMSLIVYKAVKK